MKYLLLIYSNEASRAALAKDADGLMAEVDTIVAELTASGELIGGEGLADISQAKSVRAQAGVPVVTDGPYLEAKEHLAGYCIVECDSIERALEIAKRWPEARYSGLEVRQLMDSSGLEM